MSSADDGSAVVDDSSHAGSQQMSAQDASVLIRGTPSGALLTVLKHPDFAPIRERIFAGFRVGADGLKNPIARGRLLSEVVNDSKFAAAVEAAGASTVPKTTGASPEAGRKHALHTAAPPKQAAHDPSWDHLKRELKESRRTASELQERVRSAERETAAAHAAVKTVQLELDAERNLNSWRERKIRRLEREIADLRGAQSTGSRTVPGPVADDAKIETTQSVDAVDRARSDFTAEALQRLIARDKIEAAELMIEELLHRQPSDVSIRRVRAAIRAARGAKTAAMEDIRFVFDADLAAGHVPGAASTLVKAEGISGSDEKMARALYAAAAKRPATIPEIATVLRQLAGSAS